MVRIGLLLLGDGLAAGGEAVALLPQQLGGVFGLVERRDRVFQGVRRPLVNLLKMRRAGIDARRGNIEGERPIGQTERIEVAVGVVERLLEGRGLGDQLRQLRYRGPVDDLNTRVGRIRILGRQQ